MIIRKSILLSCTRYWFFFISESYLLQGFSLLHLWWLRERRYSFSKPMRWAPKWSAIICKSTLQRPNFAGKNPGLCSIRKAFFFFQKQSTVKGCLHTAPRYNFKTIFKNFLTRFTPSLDSHKGLNISAAIKTQIGLS